jgi:menaquinone-specific isochorismate synthase
MPYHAWEHAIQTIISRATAGELQKVVLARLAEARFASKPDLIHSLNNLNHSYPDTYRFLFEPRPGQAFLGATPELLAAVSGRSLTTMALAGSIKRGQNPQEDAELAAALLDSSKDRYEHQIVIDQLRYRLTPISSHVAIGQTGVLTLRNIQHLHTPVQATLYQAGGILPILEVLHPTPALGGEPRALAMDLIAELEPAPRGWYAAPIGWVDSDLDGQFAVAIRSAVVQDARAWLYAGAGIVAASDPQREWEETMLKFRPMMNALS